MIKQLVVPSLLALTCSVAVVGQVATTQSPASADFVRPGETEKLPASVSAAVGALREAALASHIAALSAPAYDGRALGGRGLDAAIEYAAAALAVSGVVPLAPGAATGPASAYFQHVPLVQIAHPSGEVTVSVRRGESVETRTLRAGVDAWFPEVSPTRLAAPLVFAGFGIRETTPARDDYRNLDVKDRIVVIVAGLPTGAEWQTAALTARYSAASGRLRFAAKAQLAASLGARAVIAIEDAESSAVLASKSTTAAATFYVAADTAAADTIPVVQMSARGGASILGAAGIVPAAAPRALPGIDAAIQITGDERAVSSRNVLAVVPGSDPKLRDEAVVVGAHIDHLGRAGDALYPGADDNASGVAALLEIARTIAAAPVKPKRTMVFACWTGEEEGKLGSGFYVRHPAWPLERTSVYLNLDMIAHPWTVKELRQLVTDTRLERGDEFVSKVSPSDFIELGVAEWAADVSPVLLRAARGTGLALHLDRTDGKNGGSDYRDFARRGLPWVRFFGNYFDGYHEPTDTFDKLDTKQVMKMTRLALASAWLLADAPSPRTATSERH